MPGKTHYTRNAFIDWWLRGQSPTPPTNVYVALFLTAPNDYGMDFGGLEASFTNYSRRPIACSLAGWSGTQATGSIQTSSGSLGQTTNNASVTFSASGSYGGSHTHWGLFDQASGGNLLYWGLLTPSILVNVGTVVTFPPGTLAVLEG